MGDFQEEIIGMLKCTEELSLYRKLQTVFLEKGYIEIYLNYVLWC